MIRLITLAVFLFAATGSFADDWQPLFDGKTLDGWKKVGGGATYEVVDGTILGTTGQGKNTFLTRGPFADFVLEFEVKCDPKLNSGVQIRSHQYEKETPQESKPNRMREKGEVYGYQCEIRDKTNGENGCSGNFWDEGRRTKWLDATVAAAEKQKTYKPGEWNKFTIVAQGKRIRSFINDVAIADFQDDRDASGFIGLQVHSIKKGAGPYKVAWKNIRLRKISSTEEVKLPAK